MVYPLQASLIEKIGSISWPRWTPPVDQCEVEEEFCAPLKAALSQVRSELSTCLYDPASFYDMSFLDGTSWCNAAVISTSACSGPFSSTCVCNEGAAGCDQQQPVSACGNPLAFHARQQVAVCETADMHGGRFGNFFDNQTDNRVRSNGCRENFAMIFSDGSYGGVPGVAVEAANASWKYASMRGDDNLFLFQAGPAFAGDAGRMSRTLSQRSPFNGADVEATQIGSSIITKRAYTGVYTGARMGIDGFQTRAFFHIMTVPDGVAAPEGYLGYPTRIAVHAIESNGAINPAPLYETDWANRARPSGQCGGFTFGAADRAKLGPGGTFRGGTSRSLVIPPNSIDRTGDGLPDRHPPLSWGRTFGFATTTPVVVEQPRESPSTDLAAAFFQHQNNVQTRPRMIYTMDGGYVLGFYGGSFDNTPRRHGDQVMAFSYNDNNNEAGTEVFRYAPPWLNDPEAHYQYDLNDVLNQPMTTGEIIAREVFLGPNRGFRTLLIGNQGHTGRGYFVLDVTHPCSAQQTVQRTTWQLPSGDSASAVPEIYSMPSGSRAVIITGGLDGSPHLYMYNLSGARVDTVALPGPGGPGRSYPSAPIGIDVTGEGYHTHYYVVREDGMLVRIEMGRNGFGNVADITPQDRRGNPIPIGGNRRFHAAPMAYFGADGLVNIVYGSGNVKNLTAPSAQNYVYRVRDRTTRLSNMTAQPAEIETCDPDGTGSQSGIFPLGNGERLISAPVISKGVVSWAAFSNATVGCVSGSARLYAMHYETCSDVINLPSSSLARAAAMPSRSASTNPRPTGVSAGVGLPASPVLNRRAQQLYLQTSAGPTSGQVFRMTIDAVGGARPNIKKLYWRVGP